MVEAGVGAVTVGVLGGVVGGGTSVALGSAGTVGEAGAEAAEVKPGVVAGGEVGVDCATTAVGVTGGDWPAHPISSVIAVTMLIAIRALGNILTVRFISHSFNKPIRDEILPEDPAKEK